MDRARFSVISSHGAAGRGAARIAAALLLLLGLVRLLAHNPYDWDLGARLATGRLVLETGSAPRRDPFAWTPRYREWIDHEWGAGVVFETLRRLGGLRALFWFKAALFAAVSALAWAAHRATRGDGRISWWAWAVLLPALLPAFENTVRAQVFTAFFFAVALFALAHARRSGRFGALVLLWPSMTWVAAHLHGGALVFPGLAVAALPLAAGAGRRAFSALAASAALSGAALFATPYGAALPLYLVEAVAMPRPGIREWLPPEPRSPAVLAIGGLVLLVFLRLVRESGLRGERRAWLPILALALAAGLAHRRHLPFAALALFVAGGDGLSLAGLLPVPSGRLLRRGAIAAGLGAALGLGATAAALVRAGADRPDRSFHPVYALEALARVEAGGRLLCGFNEGSYAIARLAPRWRVSLDGRYEEVYPERTKRRVQTALLPATPLGRATFAALDPDAALFRLSDGDPGEPPDGYVVFHRDAQFVVWLRARLAAAG